MPSSAAARTEAAAISGCSRVGDVLDGAAGVQVRRPPHADPLAVRGDVVQGHQVGEGPRAVVAPHDVGVAGHHAVERVDLVDPLHLDPRRHRPHEDAADELRAGPVAVQVEAIRIAGVDEQLVRREADQHVRIARIDADVPLAGLFPPELVDDPPEIAERLTEDQPSPAEVEDDVGPHALELVLGGLLPGAAGDRRRRGDRTAPVAGDPGCSGHRLRPRGSAARARAGPAARACCP